MKYALLIYNTTAEDGPEDAASRPAEAGFVAVLDRPEVAGWVALNLVDSATTDFATTVTGEPGRTLLTDGPVSGLAVPVGQVRDPELPASPHEARGLAIGTEG